MARLIDSSVAIEMERRDLSLNTLKAIVPGEPLVFAAITASELLFGIHRAVSEWRRSRRIAFVEALLGEVPTIPFDLPIARVHAQLLAELTATGQRIGANDLQIAATALALGYDVLTDNRRDFERVPGLAVQRPIW